MIENLGQNQIIFFVILMTTAAIPVGFVAGLFGVGGGLITVPVLFYIFDSAGLDRSFIMHLAVGTSFAIIIPTSFISTMTHMRFKAVDFDIVKSFGAFVVVGIITGTIFAAILKTAHLILFFSLLKLSSKGSTISRSDILNNLAFKEVEKIIFINRTNEKKIIYSSFELFNFFLICIFYTNEKT